MAAPATVLAETIADLRSLATTNEQANILIAAACEFVARAVEQTDAVGMAAAKEPERVSPSVGLIGGAK